MKSVRRLGLGGRVWRGREGVDCGGFFVRFWWGVVIFCYYFILLLMEKLLSHPLSVPDWVNSWGSVKHPESRGWGFCLGLGFFLVKMSKARESDYCSLY